MQETPTFRLDTRHVTLFQALEDSPQRHPCFVLYSGRDAGRRIGLDAARLQIGRAPDCGVTIDSPGISRRHAEVQVDGDRVTINDLGSANGTLVNDKRVHAPTALADGDLLRLGNVVLRFYDRDSVDALLHDRLYRMATIDAGTEVYTKRYLFDALERELALARRLGHPLSLVCVDLDRFKAVNDRFGHNGGDTVLRECGLLLRSLVRTTDIVGRLGGEEFAIVLPDTRLSVAVELAERIRERLAALEIALEVSGPDGQFIVQHQQTASFGVAQLGDEMTQVRSLLGEADARLYAAKRGGRNRVSC